MDPRLYLQQYVERIGGLSAVAKRLGIPYPTIAAVCNGHRGIGHRLAARMVAADPDLDATILVWVRPYSAEKSAPIGQPDTKED